MNHKYICIHGHFYQPPRENAWLEVIEQQETAAPFHDWNERINFECYATNGTARILDEENKIINIVNNYARISFNFGPTLLSWMETADPFTYRAILEADALSLKYFSGHGSAIAQVHSHLILPLANARDKETQVIWGIRDFEYRFKRKPEGMWLAETAVNTETLEVLANHGILYTILAPRQAKALRRIGENTWNDVVFEGIDTRIPYLCKLPSGKQIALFFYNGRIAQDVAFNGLLNNGKSFAQRLISAFDSNDESQLVHIATDGESYGHHHRYGEMALADCLNYVEEKNNVSLTNYGEYLQKFPPQFEVLIHENSSWSCAHGVERWRNDCSCNTGGHPSWNQQWRGPLRNALDWLRDELGPIYEQYASRLIKDPWAARNDYIKVMLDRKEESVRDFISRFALRELTKKEKTQLLRLMELQRNALLMYTSCGWFFDEVSGIETNQILQYACRAIIFAHQISDRALEPEFMARLSLAPSNLPHIGNASVSYERNVLPHKVDLVRVGMHYAVSSLFEKYPQRLEFFNFIATSELFDRIEAGRQILALGRTVVRSKVTHSEKHFSFAVLYLGQLNIIGNISVNMEKGIFDELHQKINLAFNNGDLGAVIGLMQTYFGSEKYSIWHLFRDEKQKIINQITLGNLTSVENDFRNIYQDNYQLMTAIQQSNVMVPEGYKSAVQYVLNADLQRLFENNVLDINDFKHIMNEFKKWNVSISNKRAFKLTASERIDREIRQMEQTELSLTRLQSFNDILETLNQLDIKPDIWKSQNTYFNLLKDYENDFRHYPNAEWKKAFLRLGNLLMVRTNRVAEKV